MEFTYDPVRQLNVTQDGMPVISNSDQSVVFLLTHCPHPNGSTVYNDD